MSICSDEFTAKFRKVRKGAHSCQECRRRKVKCIYATPDDLTCIVCERRGARCISQYYSHQLNDPFERPRRTKAKLKENDTHLAGDSDMIEANPTYTDEPKTPLGGLITSRRASISSQNVHRSIKGGSYRSHLGAGAFTLSEPQAHVTIRDALLHALPCKTDIILLSERVSHISTFCYQSDYKSHSFGYDKRPEQMISDRSLLHPERHPTLLARQMLLFATSVQHLSPEEELPGLTEHQHIVMNRLAESAIKLVNMNDSLLGTLECLDNLIFEVIFHIDCGNIRWAWITARRAVTAAQLLSLHRPGHRRFTLIEDRSDLDPEIIWSTIVSMERMLSLLLGLPTSTGHSALAVHTITNNSDFCQNLSSLIGSLAGKILERNQVESSQQALNMTCAIDREAIRAAEHLPSAFWKPLAFAGLERDSLEALIETRRAFGQMCYYSLVVQLHLPHMLTPHDVSQRIYSKITCVNTSREILTRYVEVRMFNPISACCRMNDFLALIASIALMLGHITSHCMDRRDHLLAHQRLADRATVERALDCINPMSDLHEDLLAVRCAALLNDLLAIEEDAALHHDLHVNQAHENQQSERNPRDILILRVPHLGSIQISREGVAVRQVTKPEQVQSHSGVTIGGIGSMLIERPYSSNSSKDQDSAHIAKPPSTPNLTTYEPNLQHFTTRDTPVDLAGSPTQSDSVFPDVAVSFDDWVLQGVDTAFMETLMRGSVVPPSNDSGDERWGTCAFP